MQTDQCLRFGGFPPTLRALKIYLLTFLLDHNGGNKLYHLFIKDLLLVVITCILVTNDAHRYRQSTESCGQWTHLVLTLMAPFSAASRRFTYRHRHRADSRGINIRQRLVLGRYSLIRPNTRRRRQWHRCARLKDASRTVSVNTLLCFADIWHVARNYAPIAAYTHCDHSPQKSAEKNVFNFEVSTQRCPLS